MGGRSVGQEKGRLPARGRNEGVSQDGAGAGACSWVQGGPGSVLGLPRGPFWDSFRVQDGAPSQFALDRIYLLFQPLKHTNIALILFCW